MNDFHREDYFFAQIAFEVYLLRIAWTGTNGRPPRRFEEFLHKFEFKDDAKARSVMTENNEELDALAKKRAADASKARWLGLVGLTADGKPVANHPLNRGRPKSQLTGGGNKFGNKPPVNTGKPRKRGRR